ncbi:MULTISPECIES: trypsin-like peptidase domain-containing protein [unclassified Rathayibacter]|uniref:S1C family serine protease n=1 Tax=unclassified Rathayibacter TaxID=2609250 RepID=UPI0010D85B86|nr:MULTISPECIES: trypsin-like peptidase domain-containing protein [unclassified Rathayibacter]MCJ1703014.1 S1C family serine protease [Rathayibacter sp. VKM Ac-2926]TCL82297.1 S1-C subfamily serine protease [Rathayibacter sp. PhB192]TCM27513.1 S1-C subfamily serine protease [Rathayibacter sp. PhB179]
MNESPESHSAEREPAATATDPTGAEERQALRTDDRRRRRRALIAGGAGLALLIGVTAGGVSLAGRSESASAASSSAASTIVYPGGSRGSFGGGIVVLPYSGGSSSGDGSGSGSVYGYGSGGTGSGTSGSTSTSTATDAVPASTAQTAGVVTITSDLTYEGATSAGTGVILTSDGMILTNNHVVEGSTSITVTVESTGQAYTARVVGTDKTNDVAVLQLENASGLTPATLDTDGVAVGDAVTAVGNAKGTGNLVAAAGTVEALGQSITTQAETGITGEKLTGLIQVDADIVAGDSGGPLVDAAGKVVGIDTAASSGTADITGFAIPISKALDIVATIEAGADTSTVAIGYPAFLGVSLPSSTTAGTASGAVSGASAAAGAVIAGVIEGTPAAAAGLVAGDVVTAVDGTAVTSGDALSADLAQREPGESVTLTWTTAAGTSQSATVTLVEGPVA